MLLTDVDDVLLEWKVSFYDWVVKNGYYKHNINPENYDFVEEWENPLKEIEQYIHKFNMSDDFNKLNPLKNSVEILKNYYNKGLKIYAITACGTDLKIQESRIKNLNEKFGNIFEDIIFVDNVKNSKREILKKFKKSIWIEDNYFNAIDGINAGHKTFLFSNKKYNDDNLTLVKSWKELYPLMENYFLKE